MQTDNSTDDWDYSVPVRHPDHNNESIELQELQWLEDELYYYNANTAHDNSILEDEPAPPPLYFVPEEEPTAACLQCLGETKKNRPESLFYQTYQELQPPSNSTTTTTPTTTHCLDTSFPSSCGSSPLYLEHEEEKDERFRNSSLVETFNTTL